MLLGAHEAGHRDRAVDARRDARLREPVDRPLRHRRTASAIAVMLPHVVRWNAACVGDRYDELLRTERQRRGRRLRRPSGLAAELRASSAPAGRAAGALRDARRPPEPTCRRSRRRPATQWTGTFNPRPVRCRGGARAVRSWHTELAFRAFVANI